MPRGIILNGNVNEVLDVDLKDPKHVQEFIDHSWYTYDGKDGGGLVNIHLMEKLH